jgi:dihydrofolate reductase
LLVSGGTTILTTHNFQVVEHDKRGDPSMRKVVVSEYVTLDGVMEDPGGGEKSKHGGWSFQFWSEEAAKYKFNELFASDALLLGRVTYEGFARAWPSMKDEEGFADRMNSIPKYVVSSTLKDLPWNNSHLIEGDNLPEAVRKLKEEQGLDILVAGSARLVHTLMDYNLVDEYRLMVHPVLVGDGTRLFSLQSEGKNILMKLVDTKTFSSGIVVLSYQPESQS